MRRIAYLLLFTANSAFSQAGNVGNGNRESNVSGKDNGSGNSISITFNYDCLFCLSEPTKPSTSSIIWHPPLVYKFNKSNK